MKDYMYLRSDLADLLSAIALAAAGGNHSAEYEAGFSKALASVAAGVGLEPCHQHHTITVEQPRRVRLAGGAR